ncbi:MAG TPA: type II secretion system protein GspG [Candidatus Methylacidiphilales bacterium]
MRRKILGFVLLAMIAIRIAVAYSGRNAGSPAEASFAIALGTAIHYYAHDNGDYPKGDNAAVARALLGENPRGIVYMEFEEGSAPPTDRGFLDSWGHPYEITQPEPDLMVIRSAGPDGKFQTADDVVLGVPRPVDRPKARTVAAPAP